MAEETKVCGQCRFFTKAAVDCLWGVCRAKVPAFVLVATGYNYSSAPSEVIQEADDMAEWCAAFEKKDEG